MVKKAPVSKDKKAASIQVWYGANQSLLTLELRHWHEEFSKRHPGAVFTRLTYEAKAEAELAQNVHQAAYGGGLFSDKRLVVLEGFFKAEAKGKLVEELKKILAEPPTGVFLVLIETGKVAWSKPLPTFVREQEQEGKLTVREFADLAPLELESWIMARGKSVGGKFTPPVARLLAAMVGGDFLQLEQEIAKLTAYRQGAEVKAADLDLLVRGKMQDDVFALVEAIGRRDFVRAQQVLQNQFALGTSPQSLVGLLAWHLRVLTGVRSVLDSGKGKRSSRELGQELGLHPFVVSRALQQIPYYSMERLTWLYGELSELDVKLKSTRVDSQTLFSVFLGKLATLRLGK